MVAEVTAPIAAPYASSAGDVQKKSMASLHASEARMGVSTGGPDRDRDRAVHGGAYRRILRPLVI